MTVTLHTIDKQLRHLAAVVAALRHRAACTTLTRLEHDRLLIARQRLDVLLDQRLRLMGPRT